MTVGRGEIAREARIYFIERWSTADEVRPTDFSPIFSDHCDTCMQIRKIREQSQGHKRMVPVRCAMYCYYYISEMRKPKVDDHSRFA